MEKLIYLMWLDADSTRESVAEVMHGSVAPALLALGPIFWIGLAVIGLGIGFAVSNNGKTVTTTTTSTISISESSFWTTT